MLVVNLRIRNFRTPNERNSLNLTEIRFTFFVNSLFLNRAQYTKKLMTCLTFMNRPSFRVPFCVVQADSVLLLWNVTVWEIDIRLSMFV